MTRPTGNAIEDRESPVDLFRSIRSKIAQRDHGVTDDGITDDGITVDIMPPLAEEPAEASAPTPAAIVRRLSIGQILRDRYIIESQLGSGGMGTVYMALDRSRGEHSDIDSRVAIKVLHEQTHGRPEVLSKLRREFYTSQALSHQSIVKVYELDLHQDYPFFTMELINGETLPSVMQKFHPLTLPRAYVWAVIREVASGLAHAHERRLIHGDIKPQNIMVTDGGDLRILDFGTSADSSTVLTPAYASCEMLEGREPDARDDLFSLACLAYELLSGEHPFQRCRSTEARSRKMVPRRPVGLSAQQWKALSTGLALERPNRSLSVRAWLAELKLGSEALGPIPNLETAAVLPVAKRGILSPLFVIGVAATLVLGAVAWALLSRPKPASADTAPDPQPISVPLAASAIPDPMPEEVLAPAAAAPKISAAAGNGGAAPAARSTNRAEKIELDSAAYAIRSGQKFAEIRVHRSMASKRPTSFEWHTEPGSALAGTDYAPQAPSTAFFASGLRSVSLFVKLIPNTSRKSTDVFYVVLDNPSSGSSLGAISKSAVSLHP
jgi:serine/threonine protein kinase